MRFHSLEAFRGFAAILIVLFHSPFFTSQTYSKFIINSYIFVDFFFVLSGFIMAYSYGQRIGESVSTKSFFTKRFSRLYPLHLFTLLLWVPYLFLKHLLYVNDFGGTDAFIINDLSSFLSNLFLVQSWGFHADLTWNAPSWSISTELFAYISFYFLFYFLHRFSLAKKVFIVTGVFILVNAVYYLYQNDLGNFKLLIECIANFFAGVVVYFLWLKRPTIHHKVFISILEVFLLTLLIFTVSHLGTISTEKYLITLLFMATVYFFSIQEKGIVSTLLKHRYLQLLGLLSYSIYMTHYLIIDILRGIALYLLKIPIYKAPQGVEMIILAYASILNIIILIVVIAISYFTYHWIERPARDTLNRRLI